MTGLFYTLSNVETLESVLFVSSIPTPSYPEAEGAQRSHGFKEECIDGKLHQSGHAAL